MQAVQIILGQLRWQVQQLILLKTWTNVKSTSQNALWLQSNLVSRKQIRLGTSIKNPTTLGYSVMRNSIAVFQVLHFPLYKGTLYQQNFPIEGFYSILHKYSDNMACVRISLRDHFVTPQEQIRATGRLHIL